MTNIYKPLKLYLLMRVVSFVLGLLKGVPVLGTIFSLLGFAADLVLLYAMYELSPVSSDLKTAFHLNIIGIAVSILAVLLAVAIPILGTITVIAGLLVMVAGDYCFYYGLDDLVTVRGYEYPAGQIKWCFYWAVIGAITSVVLGWIPFLNKFVPPVVSLLVTVAQMYLLYQYLKAVEAKELQ